MKALMLLISLSGCAVIPKTEVTYNPTTNELHILRQWQAGEFAASASKVLPDGTVIELSVSSIIDLDPAASAHALEQKNLSKALDLAAATRTP